MLLESALFVHPHMASLLVGQIAGGVSNEAKKIGRQKETFTAENTTSSLDGEIQGNGDDYDPWACSSDSDCPTEPFEYECVGGRCVPVLPERVVDDSSMRTVMKDQFKCWTAVGGLQRWCSATSDNWKGVAYPTDSFGGRSGQAARLKITNALDSIPASKKTPTSTFDDVVNQSWFGNVVLDTLPFTTEMTEDSDDWSFWLGGPLVWSGFVSNGLKTKYKYKRITTAGAGTKPHQFLNKIPSGVPQNERTNFYGMGAVQEDYNLSRNNSEYGWGEWITGDWINGCGGSTFSAGGRKRVVCCTVDCRCYFRVRYKATVVPDPMNAQFVDVSNGQVMGAIYGQDASANGVQPHTLKIEIEGQNSGVGWFSQSFKPAAGDEYTITVYEYGGSKQTLRAVADAEGKAIFSYPFRRAGLYQFTVDHAVSGDGCIVRQPNTGDDYFDTVSPYFINFGLFVSPPPPKRGCTDSDSPNYDSDALIDDGSCFGGGSGSVNITGGGKGNTGFVNRFVDSDITTATGIALAGAAFLGLVFLSASFKGGDE